MSLPVHPRKNSTHLQSLNTHSPNAAHTLIIHRNLREIRFFLSKPRRADLKTQHKDRVIHVKYPLSTLCQGVPTLKLTEPHCFFSM